MSEEYRMYTTLPSVFGSSFLDNVFADFDEVFKNSRFSFEDSFPPINLYVTNNDKACYYELALTGYKRDWLSVEIDGSVLKITADVPEEKPEEKGNEKLYKKRRIRAKSFEKFYKIPDGYDTEKAEVSYEDGLLSIFIPVKEKPAETTKKLTIK